MNNGADTGDDPLLIFFEENLKWLQRRTDELKTERAMQKNKFKYESNHFSFIYLSYLNFGHSQGTMEQVENGILLPKLF